jgi:hypothetical protein
MFGEGNEPTTIEEFYNRIPQNVDLYAYNEGEVIHTNAEGIKSVGFNAWDEEWENGTIVDFGEVYNANAIISKNYISVIPNASYFATYNGSVTGVGNMLQIGFWDADQKFIGRIYPTGSFVPPINAKYMKVSTNTAANIQTYKGDICVNLSHTGYRNGEYQPYMQFIRDIDPRIREAFPNGMRSAGSAYDEVRWNAKKETWEAVKRIGVVKFKDLSWGANETNAQFYGKIVDINSTATWGAVGMLCKDYSYVKARVHSSEINQKLSNYNGYVYVADSTFANLSGFLASRGETDLYYELAEPIVTELGNDINLDYEVWDFGTEQMLSSEPSAPIKASIVYGFNAVDSVRTAQLEIAELKSQIAQMQTLMASLAAQPAAVTE